MTLDLGRASRAWRARAWQVLGPGGVVSAAVVVLVLVAALWPQLLAPGDPTAVAPAEAYRPPGAGALLGTDASGRDVYTRVVHGAGQSLGVGALATAIGLTLGVVLGFGAALGPRWLDGLLGRVIEVLFSLPSLVLALLLVAVLGAGVGPSVISVGLATAPGYARILRARAQAVAQSAYVGAARLEGVSAPAAFVRHVLPNTVWPLVAVATLGIGQAIVWVSALSYLGLGALPPSPEWGAMLNAGRLHITSSWWLTVAPGLAITVTAAALTMLGRRLGAVAPS
ncbi:ABC transporter permease [Georgenia satyanarayanai]|uniref:ABC transporter permease n=1 Tax=Georgenia satyanarayanai TaxID=860221 RepID=UPI0012646AC3|nr:ABC transporter permease [Georgenia satyanarayanai]